jgi:hypothetical protein
MIDSVRSRISWGRVIFYSIGVYASAFADWLVPYPFEVVSTRTRLVGTFQKQKLISLTLSSFWKQHIPWNSLSFIVTFSGSNLIVARNFDIDRGFFTTFSTLRSIYHHEGPFSNFVSLL